MSDLRETYQRLGEALLEEIVVRAGLDQAQAPSPDPVSVALHFVVSADREDGRLVIRGDRIGQAPLEVRLDLA